VCVWSGPSTLHVLTGALRCVVRTVHTTCTDRCFEVCVWSGPSTLHVLTGALRCVVRTVHTTCTDRCFEVCGQDRSHGFLHSRGNAVLPCSPLLCHSAVSIHTTCIYMASVDGPRGCGKGRNVTSVGWQVTLCDPMWHVSSHSGVATLRTAIHLLLTYLMT